jgi:hypothetical protein
MKRIAWTVLALASVFVAGCEKKESSVDETQNPAGGSVEQAEASPLVGSATNPGGEKGGPSETGQTKAFSAVGRALGAAAGKAIERVVPAGLGQVPPPPVPPGPPE